MLKVLFNQKKDRVIHHGTHAPTTSTISDNIEEVDSNVPVPYIPIPLATIASTDSETDPQKQPDSSNGSDEIVDRRTLPPETVLVSEKPSQPNVSSESRDTAVDKSIETTNVAESIQVDEISSSEMLEETGESENKGENKTIFIKSANHDSVRERIVEQNETKEARNEDSAQIPTQSKAEEFVEPKRPSLDKTEMSNVTRQNSLSGVNENVQPVSFGNKLCRNGGVVSAETNSLDDSETRNGRVLNGSRHKAQQQQFLFPAATPDVRTIKRRHSLNSQSRNTYADIASSDPKSYISMKLRYKVSTAKSGNATEENTLKNAKNRQISGSNKRRHSTIAQTVASAGVEDCRSVQQQQEPCAKRRTRSEDRPNPTDENDPVNQTTEDASSRLSWPRTSDSALSRNGATVTLPGQDRVSSSNTFQRRSLGKKVTPVKTIRRPSINSSNRLQQLRGSFGLRDWDQGRSNRTSNYNDRRLNRTVAIIGSADTTMPQRWLRSVFDNKCNS